MSDTKKSTNKNILCFTEETAEGKEKEDRENAGLIDYPPELLEQDMEDFLRAQASKDHPLLNEVEKQLDALAEKFTEKLDENLDINSNLFFIELVDKTIERCLNKFREAPQKKLKFLADAPDARGMVRLHWTQSGARLSIRWTEHIKKGEKIISIRRSKEVPKEYWGAVISPAKQRKLQLVGQSATIEEPAPQEVEASFANREKARETKRRNKKTGLGEE